MDWMSHHYVQKAFAFLQKTGIVFSGAWIDCGCGYGYYSKALVLLGADPVIAIDVKMRMLLEKPILVCRGECGHLSVKNDSVSGFLYVNVLHYYRRPHPLLREAYRALKNNGSLVTIEYDQVTPTGWDPYPLTLADMEPLLATSSFRIVEKFRVDTEYRPKHVVVAKKLFESILYDL